MDAHLDKALSSFDLHTTCLNTLGVSSVYIRFLIQEQTPYGVDSHRELLIVMQLMHYMQVITPLVPPNKTLCDNLKSSLCKAKLHLNL